MSWHDDLKSALADCGGRAFIYHNELRDAFPVRLCEWQEETWQEVMVDIGPTGVRESLGELNLPTPGCFSALMVKPKQARQRVELHESVRDWLLGGTGGEARDPPCHRDRRWEWDADADGAAAARVVASAALSMADRRDLSQPA